MSLIVVLVISEYRHTQDRAAYKELALNQQNYIKELLEIIRFRNGMTMTVTPNAQTNQPNQPHSNNPSKFTEKPLGYKSRIKQQEEEIEKSAQSF